MYRTISTIVIIAVIAVAGYIFLKPRDGSEQDQQPDNSDINREAEDSSLNFPGIPQLGQVFGI
jgi:protein tyrosine phosphatase (PTP) superfamily phosphohydrolase (DUF442 family)